MHVGFVGLGRMGSNLSQSAISKGHAVTGYDRDSAVAKRHAGPRFSPAATLDALVEDLPAPRTVILYTPHGDPTEDVCRQLLDLLDPGDIVVDGGNSYWADSQRRAAMFAERGIRFLDMGTSGGIPGAQHGACFMAGGDFEAFQALRPLLLDLAISPEAVLHTGPSGSGHFTKLVHNAIEFGMVQSIAEGVELLERSDFPLDLPAVFDNWAHGSVIRGWLVELMRDALAGNPRLDTLSTYVEDTQEVKWVIQWALNHDIPVPVITESQEALMEYRDLDWPTAKAVALLRHGYGGHPVHTASEPARR